MVTQSAIQKSQNLIIRASDQSKMHSVSFRNNKTRIKSGNNSKSNVNGKNMCRYCDGLQHKQTSCPSKYCNSCGITGHFSRVCQMKTENHINRNAPGSAKSSKGPSLSGKSS